MSDCETGSEAEEGSGEPPLVDHARRPKVWRWRLWGVAAGVLLAVALSSRGAARAAGETGKLAELVVRAEEVKKTNRTKPIEAKKEEHCSRSFSCVCRTCACNETTQCYQDVLYAKDTAIKKNPEWYIGLKETSTFAEFQEFFSKQEGPDGNPRCPKPCLGALVAANADQDDEGDEGKNKEEATGCHTPVKGEDCYNHVTYTLTGLGKKVKKHPSWYPGLTAESGFKEVQCLLHFQHVCPKPCGLAKATEEKIKSAGHF